VFNELMMGRQWVPIGSAWEERTARVRLYGSGVEAKRGKKQGSYLMSKRIMEFYEEIISQSMSMKIHTTLI
jgi:hypothetical protein